MGERDRECERERVNESISDLVTVDISDTLCY